MGWKIFVHSVRMVVDNLHAALRVSLLLYMVQAGFQIMLFFSMQGAGEGPVSPGSVGNLMIASLLTLLASLWIAVGWHRYVLTGETPNGWLPRWHGPELLGYLGRSFMIGLLLGLGIGVVAGLVAAAISAVPMLLGLLGFGVVGLASYVFFRVGLILPAAALGESLSLRESWEATGRDDKALVVLALLVIAAQFLIGLPAMIDGETGSVISLIYRLVVDWFAMMIGVSTLTTLYGYFIEGRSID
ncbi:hypothetical protein M4578_17145 [Salipiger sp. P9]|uniref:hypothetical protein n=1 Tax=Salipiger pentaromativorans TaxID=2943193 RepID=UPI0021570AA3|nr:hypothetical protein [Salipiger pentaromativorans]MCR8549560.1 hypothetical protein [Salipiger pentaromativorans]